jgi:WhiB family redox-sensing transcriptional regulator
MGVDNFFIDQLDPDYREKIEVAKRVCTSCKIKNDCFQYAKNNNEEFGIWAGIPVEDEEFAW